MKTLGRIAVVAGLGLVAMATDDAQAQLPIQLSFNAGLAKPLRNDADFLEQGFHVGVGLKLALIPLQLDGTLDMMSAKGAGDDLTIFGATVSLPISITPPLSPIGVYFLAGGGLFNQHSTVDATDVGISAGAGIRLNIPLLHPFVEARGIGIFSEGNKLTYLTAAVGLRF